MNKGAAFLGGFLAGWGLKYFWKAMAMELTDPKTLGYGVKIVKLTSASGNIREVWLGADDLGVILISIFVVIAGEQKLGRTVTVFGCGMLLGVLSVKVYEMIQKVLW